LAGGAVFSLAITNAAPIAMTRHGCVTKPAVTDLGRVITMVDDKTKHRVQDAKLISLNEDREVEYWAKRFGVTKERLVQAVQRVGHSAAAVEADLKRIR
jgi:3-oxoacyl-[acyl-carrier-protein] synthase III